LVKDDERRLGIVRFLRNRRSGQTSLLLGSGREPTRAEARDACTEEEKGEYRYIVSDIDWEDRDGGLMLRNMPDGTPIGVLPPTATGISVLNCTPKPGRRGHQNTWCQVRYRCETGWVVSENLSPRVSRLHRVVGVDASSGLEVWNEPSDAAKPLGAIGSKVGDVVVHTCQVIHDRDWCQVSMDGLVGWVIKKNLEPSQWSLPSVDGAPQSK
jgi:hypothetical protein